MSKVVVKISISSLKNTNKSRFTAFVQYYNVTSIGKRVNATLMSYSGDIKKRFNMEEFNKYEVESDLKSYRASVKYLVEDENEVDIDANILTLKKLVLDKMNKQLSDFEKYIDDLFYQDEYKIASSKDN